MTTMMLRLCTYTINHNHFFLLAFLSLVRPMVRIASKIAFICFLSAFAIKLWISGWLVASSSSVFIFPVVVGPGNCSMKRSRYLANLFLPWPLPSESCKRKLCFYCHISALRIRKKYYPKKYIHWIGSQSQCLLFEGLQILVEQASLQKAHSVWPLHQQSW